MRRCLLVLLDLILTYTVCSCGGNAGSTAAPSIPPSQQAQVQITTTALPAANAGQNYVTNLAASGGTVPYTWSISKGKLAPGLTFTTQSGEGVIAGTPTQSGRFTFTAQVHDHTGHTANVTLSLTVASPLTLLTTAFWPIVVGVPCQQSVAANGGVPPYQWAVSSALPTGLKLDPISGAISGVASTIGVFSVSFVVRDSAAPSNVTTADLSLVVIAAPQHSNNSIATASVLPMISGTISFIASFSPFIMNGDEVTPDIDYYQFSASSGTVVTVETSSPNNIPSPADPVIEILDMTGQRFNTCRDLADDNPPLGVPIVPDPTPQAYDDDCINDDKVIGAGPNAYLEFQLPGDPNTITVFNVRVFDWHGNARPDLTYQLTLRPSGNYIATPTHGNGTVDLLVNNTVTCDGHTDATAQMLALIKSAGLIPTKLVFTNGQCMLSKLTFPESILLDLTQGGGIQVVTGQTVTITGPVIAPRRKIFFNALAAQGRVTFSGNSDVDTFYPDWWGAVKDGATNDLPALQAATDAADTATDGHGRQGATIDLGMGTFYIGTGTWKIGTDNKQHHLNITGLNINGTLITTSVPDNQAAIYLNLEKYVTIANFSLQQVSGTKIGYGIQMGGDNGPGTQTNGCNLSHIYFSNFHFALSTSGGIGTTSEIVFDQLDFEANAYGFYSANFNGLNYVFNMVELWSNSTAGIDVEIGNVTVIGGGSNNNGQDFHFGGGFDQTVKIVNFRSELPKGYAIEMRGCANYSIEDSIFHSAPGQELIWAICNLRMVNTTLDGWIQWQAQRYGFLELDNVSLNMPGSDWSLTNQLSSGVYPFGPGFRLMNGQGSYSPPAAAAQFSVTHVFNSATGNLYPDVDGIITTRPSGYAYAGWNVAVALNKGESTDPLTIVGNAVSPYAYVSHINGAGVIKNIIPPVEVNAFAGCLLFIPDQAFTTDTTGNIGKASVAVIGQTMTFCKDQGSGIWYPSY